MYSFINGAKGGLVSGELALVTETRFKMDVRGGAGRHVGRLRRDFRMARAGSDPDG